MKEPIEIIKRISKLRGHTEEQEHHFFVHGSAVEQVDTVDGVSECFRLGWLAREKSGIYEHRPSHQEFASSVAERLNDDAIAEAHFTLQNRKAAEVNEGGLVDPRVP
jgi:hypothetical protein